VFLHSGPARLWHLTGPLRLRLADPFEPVHDGVMGFDGRVQQFQAVVVALGAVTAGDDDLGLHGLGGLALIYTKGADTITGFDPGSPTYPITP
jgi:hypothetical protein